MGKFGRALNVVQLEELMFRGVVHELGFRVELLALLGLLRWRFAMPRAKVPRLTTLASTLLRGPRNFALTTPKEAWPRY